MRVFTRSDKTPKGACMPLPFRHGCELRFPVVTGAMDGPAFDQQLEDAIAQRQQEAAADAKIQADPSEECSSQAEAEAETDPSDEEAQYASQLSDVEYASQQAEPVFASQDDSEQECGRQEDVDKENASPQARASLKRAGVPKGNDDDGEGASPDAKRPHKMACSQAE